MLAQFVDAHRDEIIKRCQAKVAKRPAPTGTEPTFDHGVPAFLDELTTELRNRSSSNTRISATAGKHGHDMLAQGFTPSQVVHDYGDVCQTITEMAIEKGAPISTEDFRALNRCLDDAIASAVTVYGNERDEFASDEAVVEIDRLRGLVESLARALQAARAACDAIRSGKVGPTGSTGDVLFHSLAGAERSMELLRVEVTKGLGRLAARSTR